jgi:hypothetical protein
VREREREREGGERETSEISARERWKRASWAVCVHLTKKPERKLRMCVCVCACA